MKITFITGGNRGIKIRFNRKNISTKKPSTRRKL